MDEIGSCRRCATGTSYRSDVADMFQTNKEQVFTRASILERLFAQRHACENCADNSKIGLLVYHLRQDGVVEAIARGKFRYRNSDVELRVSR